MQEVDAQRRLAILRGEAPPALEDAELKSIEGRGNSRHRDGVLHSGSLRRKRKRPGEDDTDFELRVARERNELTGPNLEGERKTTSSAPIVDHNGNIDLFGSEVSRAHAEKNEEAEKEARKKKQSYEDQYTMRFSNAAGKDGLNKPWYSQSDTTVTAPPMKDVWGNEDPRRKERDAQRIVASDPLAMMKKGASKVREITKERRKFEEERREELRQMRREERDREKRKRRHEEGERGHGSSRHGHRRRRSRSRERDRRDGDERKERRRSREREPRRRDSRSPDRESRDRHRRHRRRDEDHD